jgi:signal transduction histidine kinase
VVSHRDITQQKRGERALHTLSGRLIAAQEEERRRIARDLHDDIGQRVALLGMEIEQAAAAAGVEESRRIRLLGERLAEVATEIHRLSHTLHSAKLDALGLVAAVRAHCRDMVSAGLEVRFSEEVWTADIPRDVALCLFRVVQESLNNVLKHSGSGRADVRLVQEGSALMARITDEGKGFDMANDSDGDGLGLVGMRERLGACGGALRVFSRVGVGTTIEAVVPLAKESREGVAALLENDIRSDALEATDLAG